MKLYYTLLFCLISLHHIYADAYIERLDIEQAHKQVNISFDLAELPTAYHYYQVTLKAKLNEQLIFANELVGDVGMVKAGGKNKHIAWNAWKDLGDQDGELTIALAVDLYEMAPDVSTFCPWYMAVELQELQENFEYGIEIGKEWKAVAERFREVTFIYDIAGESFNYFQYDKEEPTRLVMSDIYRPKQLAKALIGFWGIPPLEQKGTLLTAPQATMTEMPLALLCKDLIASHWGKTASDFQEKHIIIAELTTDPIWKKKQFLFIFWNKAGAFTEPPAYLEQKQFFRTYQVVRVDR